MFFILLACKEEKKANVYTIGKNSPDTLIRYARRFSIQKAAGYRIVYLFGHRNNTDTTAKFLLYQGKDPGIQLSGNVYRLNVPCRRIAALSSIYANALCELKAVDLLAGIDNVDYVNNPEVLNKFKQGKLKELSKGAEPDLEQLILLKPDMIFMFGMGDPSRQTDVRLIKSGIPVAVSVDHLEESPLARAEWIKFFGAFTGKESSADSIFNQVELRYNALKDSVKAVTFKPKVLTEIKYGETWYVPGGKSFMASLLNDAGADYLWSDNTDQGSIALSFEQVYLRANKADFWINLSTVKSKKELLAQEARYSEFRAFKSGQLFNNNKITNAKGYSDYWESAMIHPERVLSDLIRIFHTENAAATQLYYYRKLDSN